LPKHQEDLIQLLFHLIFSLKTLFLFQNRFYICLFQLLE